MKKSMVIRLNYHDFNKIMKSCAKFANPKFAKKSPRANMMTKIELSSDGKKVTAVALDGYKLLKISVPAMKNSDEGKIIIPAIKAVGKDAKVVEIISDENDVTVKCATRKGDRNRG